MLYLIIAIYIIGMLLMYMLNGWEGEGLICLLYLLWPIVFVGMGVLISIEFIYKKVKK